MVHHKDQTKITILNTPRWLWKEKRYVFMWNEMHQNEYYFYYLVNITDLRGTTFHFSHVTRPPSTTGQHLTKDHYFISLTKLDRNIFGRKFLFRYVMIRIIWGIIILIRVSRIQYLSLIGYFQWQWKDWARWNQFLRNFRIGGLKRDCG